MENSTFIISISLFSPLIPILFFIISWYFRGIYSFKYKKQDYMILKDLLMEDVLETYRHRITDINHKKTVIYHVYLNKSGKYYFTYCLEGHNSFYFAVWLGRTNRNDKYLFNIIFKESLNNMPLYINHEDAVVRVLSQWRLKIGK